MTPHYADDWLTVYHGDARSVLAELPAESVHCVVTSPPYWGLRDYGTAAWEGGDEACDHAAAKRKTRYDYGMASSPIQQASRTGTDAQSGMYAAECPTCGARRIDSQLGLEPTPEQYVENMVAVFREVRRVLRSDGTVWLNLGDSYVGGGGFAPNAPSNLAGAKQTTQKGSIGGGIKPLGGLKPKDLVGIPWRVAFALQTDGWYLRSDIIWSKPNPMPESVTDRPTKSHEYLFLLSKSARYYYDADAVREDGTGRTAGNRGPVKGAGNDNPFFRTREGFEKVADKPWTARNLRSVWSIATQPYPGAHFATFPPKLVEPCIKAGTSERGVCPECGAPWVRVVARGESSREGPIASGWREVGRRADPDKVIRVGERTSATTGWMPSCSHGSEPTGLGRDEDEPYPDPAPATVLDPFAGSGTTGMVAQSLSRRAVLIDLSMDYLGQLMERNRHIPLGLS